MLRLGWVAALFLTIGVLGTPRPAGSQTLGPVVYDNGPGPTSVHNALTSRITGGAQIAAPFRLTTTTTIAGARWWGVAGRDLRLRIFPYSGAIPSITPLYDFDTTGVLTRTPTTPISGVTPQNRLEAPLPVTTLPAGDYLLSIAHPNAALFAWSYRSGGALRYRGSDGETWTNSASFGTLAFQLTGELDAPAVPEPGAALLFLPALAAVALLRRRT